MTTIVTQAGGLPPLYPPRFQWRMVYIIDPHRNHRVISQRILTQNVLSPDDSAPLDQFGQRPLITGNILVTPATMVDKVGEDTKVVEVCVHDKNYPRTILEYIVHKDASYPFSSTPLPATMFKCYMPECIAAMLHPQAVGEHFREEHRGVPFQVERVVQYAVDGPEDPHVIREASAESLFPNALRVFAAKQPKPGTSTPTNPRARTFLLITPAAASSSEATSARRPSSAPTINADTIVEPRLNQVPKLQLKLVGVQSATPAANTRAPAQLLLTAPTFISPPLPSQAYLGLKTSKQPSTSFPSAALRPHAMRSAYLRPQGMSVPMASPSTVTRHFTRPAIRGAQYLANDSKLTSFNYIPPSTPHPEVPPHPARSLSSAINDPDTSKSHSFGDERDAMVARYKANTAFETNIPVDEIERFCICNEPVKEDDRTLIECSNEEVCVKQWFHTDCIGMKKIPGEQEDWFCNQCTVQKRGKLRRPPTVVDLTISDDETKRSKASGDNPVTQSRAGKGTAGTQNNTTIAPQAEKTGRLSISAPPPVDLKPWCADLDRPFINNPYTASDLDIETPADAKTTFCSQSKGDITLVAPRVQPSTPVRNEAEFIEDTVTPMSKQLATSSIHWTEEEEDIVMQAMVQAVNEQGLQGDVAATYAHNVLKSRGFHRTFQGLRMVWCRRLRELSEVDERRRKRSAPLKTSNQTAIPKGASGTGRGGSIKYGKLARAELESMAKGTLKRARDDTVVGGIGEPRSSVFDLADEEAQTEVETTPTKSRRLSAFPRQTKAARLTENRAEWIVKGDQDIQDTILLSLANEPNELKKKRAKSF